MSSSKNITLKTPYFTLVRLLNNGGLSRRKFLQIISRVRGWREHQNIGELLQQNNVVLIAQDGSTKTASYIVDIIGIGEDQRPSVDLELAQFYPWKRLEMIPSVPSVKELLKLAINRRANNQPVKLTRRERRRLGKQKIVKCDLTVSHFFKHLRELLEEPERLAHIP